ncbi:flagellar hook-length control protein FliK [Pseudoxanthomonas sp. PXM01]|uniref:flagellar hook-length control protein FliK n=1 Tax=Pseudoxanthomonas sp. PXM01 TaxID=2769295 RepID=UPI001782FF1F|nr:flagellar hook-length control protein FliK [Pseudoxanthomonas sp. PXM01]MBD9467579.1 flagellar hook-length control protein FliK [Pseudoxanthomonas sp. PXM01]
MPSPTSALTFAVKPPPTAAGSNATSEEPAKKTAFDDLVRRPARRDDAPRTTNPRNGETKESVRQRPDRAVAGKQDEARTEDDKSEDAIATSAVPPILMELPPIASALPADAAAAALTDPFGNPLLGGAQPAPNTPLASDALLAGGRAAVVIDTTGDGAQAASTDTAATPAPNASEAKAPLQNLLSFATHLATGQVAAAVPDAINLGRDLVDAFRNEDGDAPAPTGNLLAGVGASNQALGLSRTETVNAMEAPSADLQGGHFDEDIGDAVRWMADQKIGHAHIKVTPNDLGTVEIRLRLEGDRIHADFASAQADVRQALESSLPRLRDMLGQHGFQLAHADVGQQHAPPSQGGGSPTGDGSGDASEPVSEAPRSVRMTARGLVDAYA